MTGEYAVIDGAQALGIPTRFGQHFSVKKGRGCDLHWISKTSEGEIWFETKISLYDFGVLETTDEGTSKKLQQLLTSAVRLNSDFLSKWQGHKVETRLEFPTNWGLGSSSTLIYCLAQWAQVDPFQLLFKTMNGSGYDIACAGSESPILYSLSEREPTYESIEFKPAYRDKLYFVHLGKKQNTAGSIQEYLDKDEPPKEKVEQVSELTRQVMSSKTLAEFEELIDHHEELIADITGLERVGPKLFHEFWGKTKSLGAWGGDFMLVTSDRSEEETRAFFEEKGFKDLLSFDQMVFYKN